MLNTPIGLGQGSATPSLVAYNDGKGNDLYLGSTRSSDHRITISKLFNNGFTTTLSDPSPQGPSLATFNDKLYVAFMGKEDWGKRGYVHLGFFNHTTVLHNGTMVQINGVGQITIARPTIAELKGILYIAWAGTDHRLNIASSPNGGNPFSNQRVLDEHTSLSPYLTVFHDQLHVTFTQETGSIVTGVFDGSPTLKNRTPVAPSSQFEPATADFGNKLYLAWTGFTGPGGTTNNFVSASDGSNFSNPTSVASTAQGGPGLGTYNGHLYYAWVENTGQVRVHPVE